MKPQNPDQDVEADKYLKKLYLANNHQLFANELFEHFMYNVPHITDDYMTEKGLIKTHKEVRILTSFGISVSQSGGWIEYKKRIQQTHKEEQFKSDLELEKLKYDLKVSKFQARTRWWPHVLSILSLFISLYAVFKDEIDLFLQRFLH